jgi:hypothetical protein
MMRAKAGVRPLAGVRGGGGPDLLAGCHELVCTLADPELCRKEGWGPCTRAAWWASSAHPDMAKGPHHSVTALPVQSPHLVQHQARLERAVGALTEHGRHRVCSVAQHDDVGSPDLGAAHALACGSAGGRAGGRADGPTATRSLA